MKSSQAHHLVYGQYIVSELSNFLFAELPQLLIEGEAYYGPNADDECENNSLIRRGGEYGPHNVIGNRNIQSEKDFGRVVESNSRIIWGLSTKRVRTSSNATRALP
jgi:hypothetical protein